MPPESIRFIVRGAGVLMILGIPFVGLATVLSQRGANRAGAAGPPDIRWHRIRTRFWGAFWATWLPVVGVRNALAGLFDDAGRPCVRPDYSWLAALPVFLHCAGLSIAWGRWRVRTGPPPTPPATDPRVAQTDWSDIGGKPGSAGPLPAWIWFLIFCVFAGVILFYTPQKNRAPRPQGGDPSARGGGWVCVGVFGLVAGLALYAFLRGLWDASNRALRRASRRAGVGDLDGAIEDLQSDVEARGPTVPSLSGLAALSFQKGDYGSAAGWLRKALAIEPKRADLLLVLAVCLIKTDALDEAREVLAPIEGIDALAPEGFLTCASAFLNRGDWYDAERLVGLAVQAQATLMYLPGSDGRQEIDEQIAAVRARVAEVRRAEDDAMDDDSPDEFADRSEE